MVIFPPSNVYSYYKHVSETLNSATKNRAKHFRIWFDATTGYCRLLKHIVSHLPVYIRHTLIYKPHPPLSPSGQIKYVWFNGPLYNFPAFARCFTMFSPIWNYAVILWHEPLRTERYTLWKSQFSCVAHVYNGERLHQFDHKGMYARRTNGSA